MEVSNEQNQELFRKRDIVVPIFNLKGIVMADGPELGVCDALFA